MNRLAQISYNSISVLFIAVLKISELYVLSSTLSPLDRGLFSLLTFYLLFSVLLSEMGIQNSIYSQSNIPVIKLRTLFWFNFVKSLVFYILLTLLVFYLCFYYENENFYSFAIIGLVVLFNAFGKFYRSVLITKGFLKQLSAVELISTFFEFSIVFIFISKLGVQSFVYGILIKFLIDNIFYFFKLKGDLSLFGPISYSKIHEIIIIGVYDLFSQLVNFFTKEIDTLIITSFYGLEILGIFNVSKQLTLKPIRLISPILNNAFFPIFNKTKNNYIKFKKSLKIQLSINSFIITMIFLFIMALKEFLVSKFFPEQSSLNINFIFIFFILFSVLKGYWAPLGSLILTLGKTKQAFQFNVFVFVFSVIVSLAFAYYFSVQWFAMSLLITTFLSFTLSYFIFYSKFILIDVYFKLTVLNAWPLFLIVVLDTYDLNFSSKVISLIIICLLFILTRFKMIKNAFSYIKNI